MFQPDTPQEPMPTAAQRLASAAHWRKRLSALGEKTCFPCDVLADAGATAMPATTTIRLGPSVVDRLDRMSRGRAATLNVILTAALVALLRRATGADAVVVGQPTVTGQPAGANTMLALRAECGDDLTFRELLLQLRGTVVEAVEHQDFPLATLAAEFGRSTQDGENPYFDVALALAGLHDPDFARTVPTRMLWAVARDDAGIDVSVRYDASRFEAASVRSIAEHYGALLERAVAQPDARLGDLDITTAEDARVTAASNATRADFDDEATIHGLFERQARATPDAVALVGDRGTLSYAELDGRANRLARTLRARGVAADDLVGVLAERSVEMLVAVLAILKAGGAYLPLDPGHPPARLRQLVADSGARLVLGRAGTPEPAGGVELIDLDAPESYAGLATPLAPAARSGDLAYVIYTSGSTGKPKGVMVEHRSVINRIGWMQRAYPIGPGDVLLQKTPISFDVSVWELFWWGFQGATLALLAPGGEKDPDAIMAAAASHQVTTMHFVPSMLAAFLAYVEQFGAARRLASLRQVFSSGEELPRLQARRFAALLPGADLINLYGPTEATVDVSHHACDPDDRRARVPIGRPIDNTRLHVVDAAFRPLGVGIPGELCIAGVGVARGYLNRPELTAERFASGALDGEDRVYRTGDLARWLPNGEIEYLGRMDQQVKVRGFRVEPGEIEECLRAHPTVRDAAVVALDDGRQTYLRGHVVTTTPVPEQELKEHLRAALPEYMLPARIVALDALPMTANGKLDRAALRAHTAARETRESRPTPPRDEREAVLTRIWADVLGIERVGVDDDLVALGANSIHFVSVLAKARSAGLSFTFQQLFRHQTVAALARVTAIEGPVTRPDDHEPFALLAPEDRARIPAGIDDAYPLSMLQAGLIYQTEITGAEGQYHDVFSYLIEGRLDVGALEEAVRCLVLRHPILRTSFHLTGFGEFVQMVHRDVPPPLEVEDLRGRSPEDQERRHGEWRAQEKLRRFSWSEPGLVRLRVEILRDDLYRYTVSQHNSALDGWSISLVHTQLFDLYFRLCEGAPIAGDPPDGHLRDFVALEREAVESRESRSFWTSVLEQGAPTELPRLVDAGGDEAFDVIMHDVRLPEGLSDRILALARDLAVPVKNVLLAAHVKALSVACGAPDVLTGYEHAGRPELPGAERALGLFLNTVPLRIAARDGSWRDVVRQVHEAETELLPHRRYPMARMKHDLEAQRPLFETVFNYTHFYLMKELRERPELALLDMRVDSQTEFVFRAEFSRHFFHDDVRLSLHYHPHLFPRHQIERIAGYYVRALEAMTFDPLAPHGHGSLLSEDELRAVRAFGEREDNGARYRHRVVGKDGVRVHVLDAAGLPAPIGAPGEVALGLDAAGPLVLTGDRGRWLLDGRLEVLSTAAIPAAPATSALRPVPAPEDPAEASTLEMVAEVWALALDLPRERIRPDDRFFELGGNSLSALRVVVELDGLVTLTDLNRELRLNELARLVEDREDEEEDEVLLHPLSPEDTGAACTLICFPYPSGHPINFRPLADALSGPAPEIAVCGVERSGHESSDDDEADVRGTAALLAEEIAASVATPVMLWGHCGGAALTLEVARLLEEGGHDVRHVFIGSKLLPVPDEMRASIALVEGMADDDIVRFMVDETGYTEMDGLDVEHVDAIARVFRRDVLAGYRYLIEVSERPGRPLAAQCTCVVSAGDRQVAGHETEHRRWSRLAPNLRLAVIDGSDHYFARTRPVETARLIRDAWDEARTDLGTEAAA